MTTPYEVLGIAPGASDEEVRIAYKRAAMAHHPDKGGSTAAFLRVKEAYAALTRRACTECGGKGYVARSRGAFVDRTQCPKCWAKP